MEAMIKSSNESMSRQDSTDNINIVVGCDLIDMMKFPLLKFDTTVSSSGAMRDGIFSVLAIFYLILFHYSSRLDFRFLTSE